MSLVFTGLVAAYAWAPVSGMTLGGTSLSRELTLTDKVHLEHQLFLQGGDPFQLPRPMGRARSQHSLQIK